MGPRTLLSWAPHPGGCGPGPRPGRGRAGEDRPAGRRSHLRRLRTGRQPGHLRAPGDRDGPGGTRQADGGTALPRPGRAVPRPTRPRHPRRHRVRPRLLPGRPARAPGHGSARPRRARPVPRGRRGRCGRGDRGRRAARRGRTAVGGDGRPADLSDRRDGLAPPRRVLRRRLRTAAGPRLLGDLRRCRLRDARLAAAAGHR